MNKQQRDYSIARIRKISQEKQFTCTCEEPSLSKHIRRAIAAGNAKVKPSKEIIGYFEERIMGGESYRADSDDIEHLFEIPASFKDAVAEMKQEQAKHEAENKAILAFAQALVDRIELGEFEDGKDPIRLMEAYSPKAEKTAKSR